MPGATRGFEQRRDKIDSGKVLTSLWLPCAKWPVGGEMETGPVRRCSNYPGRDDGAWSKVEVGEVVRFRTYFKSRMSKICWSIANAVRGREESRTNPRSFYVVPMKMCSGHQNVLTMINL